MIKIAKRSSTITFAIVSFFFSIFPEVLFSNIPTRFEKFVSSFIDFIGWNLTVTEVCVVCNRILFVAIVWCIVLVFYLIYIGIRKSVTIENRDCKIKVQYGNILKCKKCKRVINFDECYTTELGQKPYQIKPTSICGQYLSVNSSINVKHLLEQANIKPSVRKSKHQKKERYDSGTILPNGDDLLLAFAPLNENGLGVFPSYQMYVDSLFRLWQELDKYYCQKDVCVPVLGSGICRFGEGSGGSLSQQELLDIMIWSYKMSPFKIKKPCTLKIICQKKEGFSLNEIDTK